VLEAAAFKWEDQGPAWSLSQSLNPGSGSQDMFCLLEWTILQWCVLSTAVIC
jgi:hypothetical protein